MIKALGILFGLCVLLMLLLVYVATDLTLKPVLTDSWNTFPSKRR